MVDERGWKRILAIGQAVLAWMTAIGLLGTLILGIWNSVQDRISRDWDRMQRSLQQVGQGTPHERLAGVMGLSSFIASTRPEQRSQAELALSNALAIEESETVRRAIVSSFENIDPKLIDGLELERVVSMLAQVSRGLVTEGGLWIDRSPNAFVPLRDASAEARARAVASSIVVLLRKGAHPHDLSRAYLVMCDFSGMNLADVNFDNSILAWADFSLATLRNSSFDESDLEGTRFVEADLRGAKLTIKPPRDPRAIVTYPFRTFRWPLPPGQTQFFGPDFSCADLRGADFLGHPIFSISPDSLSGWFITPRFYQANLERTDFRSAKAYGIVYKNSEAQFPFSFTFGSGRIFGEVETYARVLGDSFKTKADEFATSLQLMSDAFSGSNWQSAQFPGAVQESFKRIPPGDKPPQISSESSWWSGCFPRWK